MKKTELKKYQEAFRQLEKETEVIERKNFKKNLILFCIIIPALLCFDFLLGQNGAYHWSLLPLFGWGSGLIAWFITLPKVDKTLPVKEQKAEELASKL